MPSKPTNPASITLCHPEVVPLFYAPQLLVARLLHVTTSGDTPHPLIGAIVLVCHADGHNRLTVVRNVLMSSGSNHGHQPPLLMLSGGKACSVGEVADIALDALPASQLVHLCLQLAQQTQVGHGVDMAVHEMCSMAASMRSALLQLLQQPNQHHLAATDPTQALRPTPPRGGGSSTAVAPPWGDGHSGVESWLVSLSNWLQAEWLRLRLEMLQALARLQPLPDAHRPTSSPRTQQQLLSKTTAEKYMQGKAGSGGGGVEGGSQASVLTSSAPPLGGGGEGTPPAASTAHPVLDMPHAAKTVAGASEPPRSSARHTAGGPGGAGGAGGFPQDDVSSTGTEAAGDAAAQGKAAGGKVKAKQVKNKAMAPPSRSQAVGAKPTAGKSPTRRSRSPARSAGRPKSRSPERKVCSPERKVTRSPGRSKDKRQRSSSPKARGKPARTLVKVRAGRSRSRSRSQSRSRSPIGSRKRDRSHSLLAGSRRHRSNSPAGADGNVPGRNYSRPGNKDYEGQVQGKSSAREVSPDALEASRGNRRSGAMPGTWMSHKPGDDRHSDRGDAGRRDDRPSGYGDGGDADYNPDTRGEYQRLLPPQHIEPPYTFTPSGLAAASAAEDGADAHEGGSSYVYTLGLAAFLMRNWRGQTPCPFVLLRNVYPWTSTPLKDTYTPGALHRGLEAASKDMLTCSQDRNTVAGLPGAVTVDCAKACKNMDVQAMANLVPKVVYPRLTLQKSPKPMYYSDRVWQGMLVELPQITTGPGSQAGRGHILKGLELGGLAWVDGCLPITEVHPCLHLLVTLVATPSSSQAPRAGLKLDMPDRMASHHALNHEYRRPYSLTFSPLKPTALLAANGEGPVLPGMQLAVSASSLTLLAPRRGDMAVLMAPMYDAQLKGARHPRASDGDHCTVMEIMTRLPGVDWYSGIWFQQHVPLPMASVQWAPTSNCARQAISGLRTPTWVPMCFLACYQSSCHEPTMGAPT